MRYFAVIVVFLIGCATHPPPPPPAPPEDTIALSLMVERAVYATARQRIAECPACQEDFQSTFDVLNLILNDPITLEDLCAAVGWMKVSELKGPDGWVKLQAPNSLIVQVGAGAPHQVTEAIVPDVAEAVWVGLNKYFRP